MVKIVEEKFSNDMGTHVSDGAPLDWTVITLPDNILKNGVKKDLVRVSPYADLLDRRLANDEQNAWRTWRLDLQGANNIFSYLDVRIDYSVDIDIRVDGRGVNFPDNPFTLIEN